MTERLTLANLPLHIIKSIVGYVIEAPGDFEDLIAEHATDSVFKPLPHVCSSWRAVAMPIMFSGCNVWLGSNISFAYQAVGANPCMVEHVSPLYNKYVRSVSLKLDYFGIADGSVMQRLQQSGFGSSCFPNAREANFEIEFAPSSTVGAAEALENVKQIIAFLQQALPKVNSTSLEAVDRISGDRGIHSQALGVLVDHVTRDKSSKLKLQQASRPSIVSSCLRVHNLTTLECQWDSTHSHTTHLIHSSARTLQQLRICILEMTKFQHLIFTSSNTLVVFPYLERLLINKPPHARVGVMPAIDCVAPFPRLKRLQVTFEYPFSDDLPFRSNSSTLRFVGIMLDHRTIRLLSACGVFGKDRSCALQHLVVDKLNGPRSEHTDCYREFFDWAVPRVRYLYIHHPIDTQFLLQTLPPDRGYNNLQLLSVLHSSISLSQIVQVLLAFPQLKILICRYSNMGDGFCGMSIRQVAAMLRTKYDPLNQHIQTLCINDFAANSINMVAASILLLADQCPHLRMIKFPKQREDRVLNVLFRLNQSRYPTEFRESFLSKLDFALYQARLYTIIRIKRKVLC
ncbi:hypothetical protein GGH12_002630 [Coemansia sp. RSA 1822]|nr:hypothetical protein LPJ76_005367 [Coemansia sp. RSA 638]KAJ2542740.1 hypothetical protein GGF49_002620 [Coemansia sp. RSA 1853]KAJ2563366.1 hypothetical protein GGH12_002630 [Coemansia sp. RSA 1822]